VNFWILPAGCALVLALLAAVLWYRRPAQPLWPILFACQLLALCWVVGDLWASHAASLPEKQLALGLLFVGSLGLPAAWWETTRRYVAWHGLGRDGLTSAWARLPLAVAAASWLFFVTNPWHGQVMGPVLGARNEYFWGIYVVTGWNWVLAMATLGVGVWAALRHSAGEVRAKMAVLAAATAAPLLLNVVHFTVPGVPREDTTAIGLGLSSVMVIYGILRVRLFNLMPVGLHEILRRDPNGMLLVDRDGRLVFWNPAAEKLLETFLLEPDMQLFDILAPRLEDAETGERLRDAQELREALTSSPDARPLFRYAGWGGRRWLRLSVAPIPSRAGRIVAVCLRVEDASEDHRAARERLDRIEAAYREEREESLGLMAGGIAHDFNNVLANLDGRAHLALEDISRGLPVRRHLRSILKSARLARELTAQLSSYAGHGHVERLPVEISALVRDLKDLLQDSLPANAALHVELAADLPLVQADPTQLRQVLLNLVTNAGEALGEQRGRVLIRTSSAHDASRPPRDQLHGPLEARETVLLEVADEGRGMDAETTRQVFDPFFSTKSEGRGLGLALVARIVESHQGAVTLESNPGAGTRFRLWLPAL